MIWAIDKLPDICHFIYPVGKVFFIYNSSEFKRILHITQIFVTIFFVTNFFVMQIYYIISIEQNICYICA